MPGGEGGGGLMPGTARPASSATGLWEPAASGDVPKRKRFGEPQKFVPVAFVVCTILALWFVYLVYHCLPLLQLGKRDLDGHLRRRGVIEFIVFHYLTAMLLICYVKSILTHPGEIPDNNPQWEYVAQDGRSTSEWVPLSLQEMKKTGERRHCKWCGKYKPDRCHHCRVCKTCILKMDHHCPWIYNCVGFANYKFFFLLLLYSVLDCHFIVWTMAESVKRCVYDAANTPFSTMFITFFGETLAFFLTVLITMFFCFHVWLMFKAMTTIEFCEKSLPKKEGESRSYDASLYDLGLYGNVKAVLGSNLFLWFFPCARPLGDGLNFVFDETRLTKDMESGKGIRRRTHQKMQRSQRRQYGDEAPGSSYYTGLGLASPDPNQPRFSK